VVKVAVRRIGPGQIYPPVSGYGIQVDYRSWRCPVSRRIGKVVASHHTEAGGVLSIMQKENYLTDVYGRAIFYSTTGTDRVSWVRLCNRKYKKSN
jgi:hypothetical protein